MIQVTSLCHVYRKLMLDALCNSELRPIKNNNMFIALFIKRNSTLICKQYDFENVMIFLNITGGFSSPQI